MQTIDEGCSRTDEECIDGIMGNDAEDDDNCKPAAKPMKNSGKETVIDRIMGNDAEEYDNHKPGAEPMGEDCGGEERGKETDTMPELENVYLASPDEESDLQISLNETVKKDKIKEIGNNNNVLIEGGSVAGKGRDKSVFEGDDNDLGQGKDWATLTDGAKDAGANAGGNGSLVDNIETMLTDATKNPAGNAGADGSLVKGMDEIVDKTEMMLTDDCAMSMSSEEGAEEGPVNNMDEIGSIFNFEGIKKPVCLKEFGSYMKFNNKCLHRGYKCGSIKTYLSVQLFSAPMGKIRTVQNNVAEFEEGTLNEKKISAESISEAV